MIILLLLPAPLDCIPMGFGLSQAPNLWLNAYHIVDAQQIFVKWVNELVNVWICTVQYSSHEPYVATEHFKCD